MVALKVAVCDDEKIACNIISGAIKECFASYDIPVERDVYSSAEQLLLGMKTQNYDLIFLDIDLPGKDGISFGRYLRENGAVCDIVYVSNRVERVFESFDVQPLAFVRKSNFMEDVERAVRLYMEKGSLNIVKKSIVIKSDQALGKIPLADIRYIEQKDRTQSIYLLGNSKKELIVHSTMRDLEEKLVKDGFFRCHKGFIVNLNYVELIRSDEVVLRGDDVIPLSRQKKKEIKDVYLTFMRNKNSVFI